MGRQASTDPDFPAPCQAPFVQLVEVPAGGSVMDAASPIDLYSDLPPLEGYPNRDSLKYISIYGIPEAQTVLRGTLRYKVRAQPCLKMR